MQGIKSILKQNSILYWLNATIKVKSMKARLNRINAEYKIRTDLSITKYSFEDSRRLLLRGIEHYGKRKHEIKKGDFHFFWVGACKEQDYSGFIQALKSFGSVVEFRNSLGDYGLELSPKRLDKKVVKRNGDALMAQVVKVLESGWPIDVLIGQMWSNFISEGVLQEIRAMGIIIANISMDDRLPQHWEMEHGTLLGSIGLAKGLDLVLTSSPECCQRYFLHDCPSLYWPMASDANLFKPGTVKDIDVCFVGNKYGNRGKIIAKLRKKGIAVEAYGSGWKNGFIKADKIAEVFGRSKIVLGIGTIGHAKDLFTLKLRDFDAVMSGALYITHRNVDLIRIFIEGEEIECYNSDEELEQKLIYYLSHDTERERIAINGLRKAREQHTWNIRLEQALSYIGILENDIR